MADSSFNASSTASRTKRLTVSSPHAWSARSPRHHEVVHRKGVKVTGVALNYLRVKLRSGVVGFVPISVLQ